MTENKGGRGEAGILPTELLPLSRHLKYSKNSRLHARPKSKSLRIRDSTAGSTVIHSKRRRAWNPCKPCWRKRHHRASRFPCVMGSHVPLICCFKCIVKGEEGSKRSGLQ